MDKKFGYILVGLALFMLSCGEQESALVESQPVEVEKIDTTFIVVEDSLNVTDSTITISVANLLAKLQNDTVYSLPFYLDSMYMDSFEEQEESKLTNAEVNIYLQI